MTHFDPLITGQRQNRSAQQLTLCKHTVSAHKSNRDGEKWYHLCLVVHSWIWE